MSPLRIVTHDTFTDGLAERWHALIDTSERPNVFLTPEWCATWWKHAGAGAELVLVGVEEPDGTLVGLAPLRRQLRRRPALPAVHEVSFLGSDDACPDHLEFLARPDSELAVCDAIAGYLAAGAVPWDVLRLTDVPEASPTRDALLTHLRSTGVTLSDEPGAACSYIELGCTWDELIGRRSTKTRQRIRKRRRDLEAVDARFRLAETPAEVDRALGTLFELNVLRWHGKGRVSAFSRGSFQRFHRDLARTFLERGWLDLAEITIDGRPRAAIYQFRYGGKAWFYNTGFAEEVADLKPGEALHDWMLERACDDGLSEYDFLRGEYEYKSRWADATRVNRDIVAIAATWRARTWDRSDRALASARHAVAHRLPAPLQRTAARLRG